MGTALEWVEVLCAGGFLGGVCMFIFNMASKNRYRLIDGITLASASLLFGILNTFGWHRSVHWPLLILTIPIFAAFTIVAAANRHFSKYAPRHVDS